MGTTIRYEISKGGVKTVRYIQGWRDPEQDRRPPAKVARIVSQDYELIKRECLAQGALWEDSSFPANDRSVYPSSPGRIPLDWKRPGELSQDPRMFVDGFTRFDVDQGELGNCWFLAATASLCATGDKDLFHRVVPKDNLFVKDYAGVFHFKIWQYGKWVDVVVDDRLPTLYGKLLFVHSPTNNEFWPALLEKAYAKLNGSYEALQGGSTSEAMEDFTGGVTETFNLQQEVPKGLFVIMKKAFERSSLMGCSIDPQMSGGDREGRLPNGLITAHAYSITSVKTITMRGRQFNLVRVRNPWGNEHEWKGAWSDRSPEWQLLSQADRDGLGLTFEDDGEFWMAFDDFTRNFTLLEMCMTVPAFETMSLSTTSKRKWEITTHEGSWKRYVNAGGCRNHLDTFWTNPQYKVQVVDPDEDDEDSMGTVVVALMQKDRRKKIAELGLEMLTIGYGIYRIPDKHVGPQDINFFRYNAAVAKSSTFSNVREMVGRHKLPPGSYLIVPSTFRPNEEGDFLLRTFSEKPAPSSEVDEDTKFIDSIDTKVKDDVPVYNRDTDPQPGGIKGTVLADPEARRRKSMVVTDEDRTEERELRELFRQTAGHDLEVDAYELRSILDSKFKPQFKFEGISLETARSMVAMMDVDHSGKLGYDEFKKLWTDLRQWKKVFLEYDLSRTNSLDAFEMRAALNSSGFLVSNQTLKCIVMRYSDQRGFVQFDEFILCAVRLKTMHETFREMTKDSSRPAQFTLDEFIQTTMYS